MRITPVLLLLALWGCASGQKSVNISEMDVVRVTCLVFLIHVELRISAFLSGSGFLCQR
jgi:hypothetical protein